MANYMKETILEVAREFTKAEEEVVRLRAELKKAVERRKHLEAAVSHLCEANEMDEEWMIENA